MNLLITTITTIFLLLPYHLSELPPGCPFSLHRQFLVYFHPATPPSSPPTSPRTPDNNFGNFHIPAQLSSENVANKGLSGNIFGLQTATFTKEKEKVIQDSVKKESDDTIYELPDPPKLELRDGLLNTLGVETDDILD